MNPAQVPAPAPIPAAAAAGPAAGAPAGPDYRRLHPLTPLLRGWAVVAAVLYFLARNLQDLARHLTPDRAGLGLLVLVPVALGYGFLSWHFTRYRIEEEQLRVESGVLFRRTRHLRLDRVQSIDVVRPLPARLTGLAVLKFDLAGGEKDKSTLEYLSVRQAAQLRAELLARAAGVEPTAGEAPERVLFQLDTGKLLASIALSLAPWATLGFAVLLSVPLLAAGSWAGLVTAVPMLLGVWHTTFNRFAKSFAFTLADSPDGLRISAGLLEHRHHTVPPGRVQAVRIEEPLLWRRFGWARVEINVAGKNNSAVLLPVGPRAEALELLERILPGVRLDQVALTPPPRRARLLAPLFWSRSGCGADGLVFVSRKGLVRRRTELIPHAKVQSLALTQNPLTCRLRLASVRLHSTEGPVKVVARLRGLDQAEELLAAQAERSRIGRRTDLPARWMSGRAAAAPAGPEAAPPSA
ncbi:PH domain-containing protein [Streptacidiphilus sp. N1-3]|uniref:PH domain-containing protein n=1 Tax=Streptacidiphilus alkalitolerans TaxID=3342712 RepID=A0ABV6X526_9ACTN